MPKVSPAQTNFNGGEFSPLLYGRVDADRYKTGLETCIGYICSIQGGLQRRSGTKYIAPTAVAGTKPARLQKFEFSTTQAYMLEFTDLRELQDTILSKPLWPRFEPHFVNKESTMMKFGQLSELRNRIRHSRALDEIMIVRTTPRAC